MNLSPWLHPLLTKEKIEILKQFGIERLDQLLKRTPEHLSRILKVSFSQATELTDALFRDFSVFPTNALVIYRANLRNEVFFSSGSTRLDALVNQFRTGYIYDVFGRAGTGKSQLCMSLAVECAIKHPKTEIVYLDTKGDLAPLRILQMLKEKSSCDAPDVSLLARIKVIKPFDILDLLKITKALVGQVAGVTAGSQGSSGSDSRLLIIDNITSPVINLSRINLSQAMAYAFQIQQLLKQLAAAGTCIICISHSRTRNGEELPSLGIVWAMLADIRIHITRNDDEAPERCFTVTKGLKSRASCSVVVDEAGLRDGSPALVQDQ